MCGNTRCLVRPSPEPVHVAGLRLSADLRDVSTWDRAAARFSGCAPRVATHMLILLTGWPSFLHGEATAGDVLSMDRVQQALQTAGLPVDVAWSPVFRPGAGGRRPRAVHASGVRLRPAHG
jgi:hypothetical protein